jgi:hypothetical protein
MIIERDECQKCLEDKTICKNNCKNPHYIKNRDFKCGCIPQKYSKFIDTHCCQCKKRVHLYKMNWQYICIACQKFNGVTRPKMVAEEIRKRKQRSMDPQIESSRNVIQQNSERKIQRKFERNSRIQNTRTCVIRTCDGCKREERRNWNELIEQPNGALICFKCNQKHQDTQRYGSTQKIASCEVCGYQSDQNHWMERSNGKIPFCGMECQAIYLANERAASDDIDKIFEKMQIIAYSRTYKDYKEFKDITNEEISELVDKVIEYRKKGSQANKPIISKSEVNQIVAQLPLPNELRNQIADEIPTPNIENAVDITQIQPKLGRCDNDKTIVISSTEQFTHNHESNKQIDELIEELTIENNNDILDSYDPMTGETLTTVEGLNRPQEEIDAMWTNPPELNNQNNQQLMDQIWWKDEQINEYYNPQKTQSTQSIQLVEPTQENKWEMCFPRRTISRRRSTDITLRQGLNDVCEEYLKQTSSMFWLQNNNLLLTQTYEDRSAQLNNKINEQQEHIERLEQYVQSQEQLDETSQNKSQIIK